MIGALIVFVGAIVALLVIAARATIRLERDAAIGREFEQAERDAKRSSERAVLRHTPKGRES